MSKRRKPAISARKTPKQERSVQLVDAILQAAIRVLERDGAARFTTIRVAEQAGVSVGSLYQYFPNKQSILFRLQQDEWAETGKLLDQIFDDRRLSATERLRAALCAFFRTEYDEAPLRRALSDAEPLYRDTRQAHEHRERRERKMPRLLALIDGAAPGISPRRRRFVAELYIATLAGMGKHVSEIARTRSEVDQWSAAIADMFVAYLGTLPSSTRSPRRRGA